MPPRATVTPEEADRIRAALKAAQALFPNQLQLSQRLGISQQQVSNAINGRAVGIGVARAVAPLVGLTLDQLLAGEPLRLTPPVPQFQPLVLSQHQVVYDQASPVPRDSRDSPLERAMLDAFDKTRGHTFDDVENVRTVVRSTFQHQNLGGDLVEAARAWLDASAKLRRDGQPVTPSAMLVLLTLGTKATPAQRAAAASADEAANAEMRARAAEQGVDEADPETVAELAAAMKAREKRAKHRSDE